jgi:Flp pilus assembly protein TadG
MLPFLRSFIRSDAGSVAPTVGLSIFALIAAGGIAFDYARLASMDTELQNAADQAALAAASQLDGNTGACARAAAAARDLLSNQTLFANESGSNRAITVADEATCDATGNVQFYQSYDRVNDIFGAAATTDATAHVVLVRVNPRQSFYALTPVVGAFSSGNIFAEAVAELGSAICKVPPVMMCNPAEPESNTDINYDFNAVEGQGLRLVIGDPDAPGNFGFLRTDAAGAQQVAKEVGYDNPPAGCLQTNGVDTEPGNMISVRAALNTRFDISENGATTCPAGGVCSSSRNSRKDLVKTDADGCALGNNGWREGPSPYRPTDPVNPLPGGSDPTSMGFPRDICHAVSLTGSCSGGIIGNGNWDIDAFFRVNYNWDRTQWMTNTSDENGNPLAATAADVPNVSRYDVYMWEMRNPATTIDTPRTVSGTSPAMKSFSSPICRGSITPSSTVPDRRRISVAVINCNAQNLNGAETNVQVRKWVDVFLVEPAIARGNGPTQRSTNGDIYVEVIGVTSTGGSANNTVTRRDVPYLIR